MQSNIKYAEILSSFYKLNRYSKFKYNLDATLRLSEACGNPHKQIQAVHVTGTNGKGSTVYKLAQVLIDNNIKTGFFTSPHLSTFRERIQVNNKLIEKEFVVDFLEFVFNGIEKGRFHCSFFEALTVMAYLYFKENKVDVAVIEVGIGGKMDSTNILEKNLLSIITSIGLDHCEVLGGSKEEILIQKCGIIKKNCPVLIGPDVGRIIPMNMAKDANSKFYAVESDENGRSAFSNAEKIVEKSIDILNSHYNMGIQVWPDTLRRNLSGRMEKVPGKMLQQNNFKQKPKAVIMDVGHNPAAIRHCLKHVHCANKEDLITVYGTSKLKDSCDTLREIKKYSDTIYVIQANNPRAKELEFIVSDAIKAGIEVNICQNGNIVATLNEILNGDDILDNKTVFICGSFFIMEETRDFFGYKDEKDGVFLNEYSSI